MGAEGAGADAGGEWEAAAVAGLRYDLGLTQADFSRLLGVRQQTVSEWETGLHAPRGASRRMLSIVAEQRAAYDAGPRPDRRRRRQ